MTSKYLSEHATRETAQSEPMREDQIENQAGGFVWSIGPWEQLRRFLILGSERGSYYATERKQTKENVNALRECLRLDGVRAVVEIRDISVSGRAPKNELAIFALAYAAGNGDEATRAAALKAMPEVCRTGTHLFQFVEYVQGHRGWGPALKKAVAAWYLEKEPEQLAYQLVKYRQRGGWTHADVLRLAKPQPQRGSAHDALFGWAVGKNEARGSELPTVVQGYELAQTPGTDIPLLIAEANLPREALPSEALTDPNVWQAMLDAGMPMTALIRNLANMTRIGLLTPTSEATRIALAQIGDGERIRKARVHPISVLMALRTYAHGQGVRGSNTWNPLPQIVDALDAAFYTAFANVEPTNKRYLLALDVSGSMSSGSVAGVPYFAPRDAAAAMALVTAHSEQAYEAVAFQTECEGIPLSPRQRLDDVGRVYWKGGGTDCAQPMLYALKHSREVDVFIAYTDSETWHGSIHPTQALRKYREQSGINAKLIVVGLVANQFSIADPDDAGMLDVVGFDAAAPTVMAEFAMGRV